MKNFFNKTFFCLFFLLSVSCGEKVMPLPTNEFYKDDKNQGFESAAKDYAEYIIEMIFEANGFYERIKSKEDLDEVKLLVSKLVNRAIVNKDFLELSRKIYEEQRKKVKTYYKSILKFNLIENIVNPILLASSVFSKIFYELIDKFKKDKNGFSLSFFRGFKDLSKYSLFVSMIFYFKMFKNNELNLKYLENGDQFKTENNRMLIEIIIEKIFKKSQEDILNFLSKFEDMANLNSAKEEGSNLSEEEDKK